MTSGLDMLVEVQILTYSTVDMKMSVYKYKSTLKINKNPVSVIDLRCSLKILPANRLIIFI